jgi:hypothetical protein
LSDSPSVHAFIFCWPGWEASAHHISGEIEGTVQHLTVLYKNDRGVTEAGPGDWRKIPSERFYGWQFRESLDLNRGDVMLHVQADAHSSDWPRLVARCRQTFGTQETLGVWTPNVYHSWYTPRLTRLAGDPTDGTVPVTLTDGVVWALSADVVSALKPFDFSSNNIGWGLTETAAAVAATRNRAVAMDLTLKVDHPRGSGYDRTKALSEAKVFADQLSAAQRNYIAASHQLAKLRQGQGLRRFGKPGYWRERIGLRKLTPASSPYFSPYDE